MINFHARVVAESNSVTTAINRSKKKYPRVEDVFSGLKWALARDPANGILASNPYWVIKTAPSVAAGVPQIIALYRFDNDNVEIDAVKII